MTVAGVANDRRRYPAGLNVVSVKSKADLQAFIELPWSIYRGDRYWVPPLISEQQKLFDRTRHPFYQHADTESFLAVKDSRVVGRIMAIVNHAYNEYHGDRTGFFGFFESIDDLDVARALFDTAAAWLKARDREVMLGPMNFSTNEEVGLLIDGFESSPVFMMTYNPPHYRRLYEENGLVKAEDLFAYFADSSVTKEHGIERIERIVERFRQRGGIRVRTANIKQFDAEVDRIKKVYNRAWTKNWGFVPMTEAEFDAMAKDFKQIVVPDLVLIGEADGEPVAVSLAVPDYNLVFKHLNGRLGPIEIVKFLWYRRKIHRVRLMAMGIVEEYQRRGIDAVLILETLKQSLRLGYTEAELSWVLESNEMMNNTIDTFNLARYKTYRIYQRGLRTPAVLTS